MRFLFFFLIAPFLFCGQFTIGAGNGFGDVYAAENISYFTASNGNKAIRLLDDRAAAAEGPLTPAAGAAAHAAAAASASSSRTSAASSAASSASAV